jgi:hypothetical protein
MLSGKRLVAAKVLNGSSSFLPTVGGVTNVSLTFDCGIKTAFDSIALV